MVEGTKTQFNPFSHTFANFLTLQTLDKLNVALLWCVNVTKSKIKSRTESLFIELPVACTRIYKAVCIQIIHTDFWFSSDPFSIESTDIILVRVVNHTACQALGMKISVCVATTLVDRSHLTTIGWNYILYRRSWSQEGTGWWASHYSSSQQWGWHLCFSGNCQV